MDRDILMCEKDEKNYKNNIITLILDIRGIIGCLRRKRQIK